MPLKIPLTRIFGDNLTIVSIIPEAMGGIFLLNEIDTVSLSRI
jgi:hypothetical protein